MISFLLIMCSINLSCLTGNNTEPNVNPTENRTPDNTLIAVDTMPSLKYTSGIRSILLDKKGVYWLGSHHEGVCRYDGISYKYFTQADGLGSNQVRSIQEDDEGSIWFGTSDGVSSYVNGKIEHHKPKKTHFFLATDHTNRQWSISKDDLWFNAGNDSGIYRYNGKEVEYLNFPVLENNDSFNGFGNTGFSQESTGKIWIASYEAAFGYDGENFVIIDNDFLKFRLQHEGLHIRSILADSKGNLWIGNNGIGVLLKSGDTIINFSKKKGLVHAFSTGMGDLSPAGTLEHVFVIEEDRHGNIWFGDRDTGAWRYDGRTMKNYTIDSTLQSQMIWAIYEDKHGNLLFGMAEGGVYIFKKGVFEKIF